MLKTTSARSYGWTGLCYILHQPKKIPDIFWTNTNQMQVNSLTIFIIRQNIRECQSDEAKKHPIKTGYNVSPSSQSKQITKTTKHLKVWFYGNKTNKSLKKSILILRRPTTKNSEGNLFQADATFHYTTFIFENFLHNRNYDSYIIVHTNKKIRGVVKYVSMSHAKHRIYGKAQTT